MLAVSGFVKYVIYGAVCYQYIGIMVNQSPMALYVGAAVAVKRPIEKPGRDGRAPNFNAVYSYATVVEVSNFWGYHFFNICTWRSLKIKIVVACNKYLVFKWLLRKPAYKINHLGLFAAAANIARMYQYIATG